MQEDGTMQSQLETVLLTLNSFRANLDGDHGRRGVIMEGNNSYHQNSNKGDVLGIQEGSGIR